MSVMWRIADLSRTYGDFRVGPQRRHGVCQLHSITSSAWLNSESGTWRMRQSPLSTRKPAVAQLGSVFFELPHLEIHVLWSILYRRSFVRRAASPPKGHSFERRPT